MLTGTPLDLTVIPELLQWLGTAIPIVWLVLLVGGLALAWHKARTALSRAIGVAAVLVILVLLPALMLNKLRQQAMAQLAVQDVQKAELRKRYEMAEALFRQRCEMAGEVIHKTVPDVKGIVWMKWRPKDINLSDQFDMNDPFGRDCGGEECLKELLVATEGAELKSKGDPYGDRGYQFVESVDPADGNWYRYTLRLYRPFERDPKWLETLVRSELLKQSIAKPTANYGLTWDDISTREDRENWIAGGSLSVIDLKANEVVAKRVGYMMDRGLGSRAGFRSPWSFAQDNACPSLIDETGRKNYGRKTPRFALKVLISKGSVEK